MIKLRLKFFLTIVVWGHRTAPPKEVHFRDLKILWLCQGLAFSRIPLAFQFCLCLMFGLAFSVGNLSAEDHRRKKDADANGRTLKVKGEGSGEKVTSVDPIFLSGMQAISNVAQDQVGRRVRRKPFRGTSCDDLYFSMSPNGDGDLQSVSIEQLAVPLRPRRDDALRQVEFIGAEQSSDALADVQTKTIHSFDADHHADYQWLDIRPRTIASQGETSKLVQKEDLPGNETLTKRGDNARDARHSPEGDYHQLEFRLTDFCRATRFCHGPLYFENHLMESQGVSPGHGCCPPAVYAGAHFIWSAATLPLHVLKRSPCNSVSSGCQYR